MSARKSRTATKPPPIPLPMSVDIGSTRYIRASWADRGGIDEKITVALQLWQEGDVAAAIRACGHTYPDRVWVEDNQVWFVILKFCDDYSAPPEQITHCLGDDPPDQALRQRILADLSTSKPAAPHNPPKESARCKTY